MPSPFTDVQLYEEYNKLSSFELCMYSQEITQEAVSKLSEFISILKQTSTTTLLGDHNAFHQRKLRIEEILNHYEIIFQRLRVTGTLIHQRKTEIDNEEPPVDGGEELKSNLNQLKSEADDLKNQIREKNAYLKLSIDKVSEIIWQINSMQKLRQ